MKAANKKGHVMVSDVDIKWKVTAKQASIFRACKRCRRMYTPGEKTLEEKCKPWKFEEFKERPGQWRPMMRTWKAAMGYDPDSEG
eukprot:673029-Karenia_brevis.AAC.1